MTIITKSDICAQILENDDIAEFITHHYKLFNNAKEPIDFDNLTFH